MRIIFEFGEGDRPPTHQEYQIVRQFLGVPDQPEEGQPARLEDLPDNGPFQPVPMSTYGSHVTVQGMDMGEVLKRNQYPGTEAKAAPSGS